MERTREMSAVTPPTDSPREEDCHASLGRFFTQYQWLIYAGIILGGLLLRWVGLGDRPYHHDESLHGMYGRYFYDWPDINFYKYNPMLHGPFLYNLLRVVYSTVGDSNAGARSVIALIGSAFLFVPFLFRRYLTPATVLASTAAIAFSPTLVYWSRFLREDFPVIASMLMMLYGVVCAAPRRKAFFVVVGLVLQFTMKENAYVTTAILLGYVLFEALFVRIYRRGERSLLTGLVRNVASYPWEFVLSAFIGAFIYCYLYSAGFRYQQGILDGLYRESIGYWVHHHEIERISGPFNFHFYVLSWYELPFVAAFLAHVVILFRQMRSEMRAILLAAAVVAVFCLFRYADTQTSTVKLFQFFKLKDHLDVAGLILMLVYAPLVTIHHLMRGERALAFFAYLFSASLFSYSYLGEKVPWLTMYPFIPGLAYLTLFFQDFAARRASELTLDRYPASRALAYAGGVVLVLGLLFMIGFELNTEHAGMTKDLITQERGQWMTFVASGISLVALGFVARELGWLGTINFGVWLVVGASLFNLRAALLTNFVYAGQAREFLSQVHTTPEYDALMKEIRKEIELQNRGFKPSIGVVGEAVWPSTWYLRDLPEYKFTVPDNERDQFNYIVQDWVEPPKNVPPGFNVAQVKLRGWWVPDYRSMTLRKFLQYSLNHTPWSEPGWQFVNLLVKTGSGPAERR